MNIKRIKKGISYLQDNEVKEVFYDEMCQKATGTTRSMENIAPVKELDTSDLALKQLASNYLEVHVKEIDILK